MRRWGDVMAQKARNAKTPAEAGAHGKTAVGVAAPAREDTTKRPRSDKGSSRPRWTPDDDDRLLALREQGLSLRAIAERIGRSKKAVELHLAALGASGGSLQGYREPVPTKVPVPALTPGKMYELSECGHCGRREVLRARFTRARFLGAQVGAGVTHFRFEVAGLWPLTLTDRDFADWRAQEVA